MRSENDDVTRAPSKDLMTAIAIKGASLGKTKPLETTSWSELKMLAVHSATRAALRKPGSLFKEIPYE
jgi:hypothetical protein